MIDGAQLRGVITDWGGVLTTPILTTVQAWIQADDIDWDSYRTVMRAWVIDTYGPIFLHAAKSLGLDPEQCVFIDDIEANVAAAAACGMTGVHHADTIQTAAALRDLLGVLPNGVDSPASAGRSSPGNTMR